MNLLGEVLCRLSWATLIYGALAVVSGFLQGYLIFKSDSRRRRRRRAERPCVDRTESQQMLDLIVNFMS